MKKIAVIYFSKTDVTGTIARELIKTINNFSTVDLLEYRIQGSQIIEGRYVDDTIFESLSQCDGIIFGSPTYMGGVSAQFKAFADAASELWCEQKWADKLAAGFTSGSALNGDQSNTLQYFSTLASQHGMLWVGLDSAHGYRDHGINRLGCQLGVVAHAPNGIAEEADLGTARYLGQRFATLLTRQSNI